MRAFAPPLLLAGLLLCGCADTQAGELAGAARSFSDALGSGDPATACEALAPRTREELEQSEGRPCPEVLPEQQLLAVEQVIAVERYGRQGLVRVLGPGGDSDTWFLSRFDGRWLLAAAACESRGDLPYACELEGE